MRVPVVRKDDGFTLVEVMVAVLLLTVILMPFMGSFTEAFKLLYRGSDKTVAIYLLQERAEEIKAEGYDNLPLGEIIYSYYSGSKYTLKQDVTTVEAMEGKVKKVHLEIHEGDRLIDTLTFLLYEEGI